MKDKVDQIIERNEKNLQELEALKNETLELLNDKNDVEKLNEKEAAKMENKKEIQNVGNCQNNKIRLNIFLTPELKEYVKTMSDSMGMSNSAFCVMCISQYKQGQEVSKAMVEFKELMDRLQELQGLQGK